MATHVSSTRGACRRQSQLGSPAHKPLSAEPYSVPGLCASRVLCQVLAIVCILILIACSLAEETGAQRNPLPTIDKKTRWPRLSPPSPPCLPSPVLRSAWVEGS